MAAQTVPAIRQAHELHSQDVVLAVPPSLP
jgi:hypothetical protein